jgi:glycosyltransferase involved in cell wall biosynthesis
MRIGIVMPAYNVAPYIGAAIGSVLAQTHRNWTMTIVDDGSTDATAAIAAACLDPRCQLIRQCNKGVSAARNLGLAETDADAVLFLDADDWLAPGALSILSAALEADPGAVAAVGAYRLTPGESAARHRRSQPPAGGDLLETLLVRNVFANGGHLLIRRDTLRRAGAFHTGLRYGEDWEYWVRLACLGKFIPTASEGPLLFVRERQGGAYLSMASHPESFAPGLGALRWLIHI